ncbi:MAG: type II toxin-antitoxin system VapC family toxin [Trueperaceae bacterium]
MVVDTSVLLHIAFAEPGWESSVDFLRGQARKFLAAPSFVEAQVLLADRV